MDVGIIVAIVGVVGAVLGATVSSWLGARQSVAQEIRQLRVASYPTVWRRTSVVSRWPRTDVTTTNLERLHRDLRLWYYGVGGMAMSANTRKRYGALQELIETMLMGDSDPSTPLDVDLYQAVLDSASAFRTALTEDLQSRNQRSVILAIRLALQHRGESAAAGGRLLAVRRTNVGAKSPRHHIGEDDERLVDSATDITHP
jgi:hypothetical protein